LKSFLYILFFICATEESKSHDLSVGFQHQKILIENNLGSHEEFSGNPMLINFNFNPDRKIHRTLARISLEKINLTSSKKSKLDGSIIRFGGGIGFYQFYLLGLIGLGNAIIKKNGVEANYNNTSGLINLGPEYYLWKRLILRTELQYEFVNLAGSKTQYFDSAYIGGGLRYGISLGFVF
jgi:hypothetical protein